MNTKFFKDNFIWMVLILFCCIFLNTCRQTNINKRLVRQNQELVTQNQNFLLQLDSIKHEFVNKEELQMYLKIEGYRIGEQILNDFHGIVRATDRSEFYRRQREQLERIIVEQQRTTSE